MIVKKIYFHQNEIGISSVLGQMIWLQALRVFRISHNVLENILGISLPEEFLQNIPQFQLTFVSITRERHAVDVPLAIKEAECGAEK